MEMALTDLDGVTRKLNNLRRFNGAEFNECAAAKVKSLAVLTMYNQLTSISFKT
jgi:hypothetical protein